MITSAASSRGARISARTPIFRGVWSRHRSHFTKTGCRRNGYVEIRKINEIADVSERDFLLKHGVGQEGGWKIWDRMSKRNVKRN